MEKHLRKSTTSSKFIVDSDTGEVLEDTVIKHTYLAGSKEQFFIGYVTLLSVFQHISAPSIKIFAYMLERYNAGVMIAVNKAMRNEIKEELGFTGDSTVNNALTELVRVNLLYKKEGVYGAYYINPRHAFKGSTKNRDKLLKTVIELQCKDC